MTREQEAYVPQIDALRAMAVVAVMVFHMRGQWLPGGYAGVDVFFVVSGYVISRSMLRSGDESFPGFIGGFYSRRVLRILPALLVCMLVSFVLATVFVPESWLSAGLFDSARRSVLGIGNYALLNAGDSYFAPRVEFNPFAHTWSLGVEEQFYLLFPVVFFAWLRTRKLAGWRRFSGTGALGILTIASMYYSAHATSHDPSTAYYTLSSRFWELAAGALLFQWHATGVRATSVPGGRVAAQVVLALFLVAFGFVASVKSAFPFPWALAAVIGTAALIDGVTTAHVPRSRTIEAMGHPALAWIGRRSYSLYLWHWPIYVLCRWTIGFETPLTRAAALVLTIVAASASYEWVETPCRRSPLLRRAGHGRLVLAGLGSMAATFVLIGTIRATRVTLSASVVTTQSAIWYPENWSPAGNPPRSACRLAHSWDVLPGGGTRELMHTPSGCGTDARAVVANIFVVGNSHALAYRTMLSHLASAEPFDVQIYQHSPCTFLDLNDTISAQPACSRFFRETLADIRSRARPGDILFLPSLRLPRLSDQWAQLSEPDAVDAVFGSVATARRRAARSEASAILRPLTQQGVRVLFEAPKPIFRTAAFRCSDWFDRQNRFCAPGHTIPRQYMLWYRGPVLGEMTALAADNPRVTVWDPFDALCPASTCSAIAGDKPVFFDGDHLSGYGNGLVYPGFLSTVTALAAMPVDVPAVQDDR